MRLRPLALLVTFTLGLLAAPQLTFGQSRAKVPRIGVLCPIACFVAGRQVTGAAGDAFLKALRDLGYVDGENVFLDFRGAGVAYSRLADQAAELVRRRVDLLLVEGSAAAQAARRATGTIPVVMLGVPDAVELGLVSDLARPQGNVTGVTFPFAELAAKQLELVKEVVPGVSRVALLSNQENPEHAPALGAARAAAKLAAVELRVHNVRARDPQAFRGTLAAISRERAGALLVLPDAGFYSGELLVAAIEGRIPTVSTQRGFVAGGGLMAYGPHQLDMVRRVAAYVDRLLRGAKPTDLPVEQPTRYELVVSLTTAKALGLTIPQTILARADEVVR
jgi:putative ABC transport system substrate-binding protein